MINAIAIDDEPLPLEILKGFCAQIPYLELQSTFTQTKAARAHLQSHTIDLLFLDIQMPAISGIDFVKELELTKEMMIIFTTAYSEYALEGFNLNAIDYLLKPYDYDRFIQAVQKAQDYFAIHRNIQQSNQHTLHIKADYSVIKLNTSQILYIEGLADYLKIHVVNDKPLITRMTMKGILQELPDDFIRIHRSFIVPLHNINSVRNKSIQVAHVDIPIGKTYYKDFINRFHKKS